MDPWGHGAVGSSSRWVGTVGVDGTVGVCAGLWGQRAKEASAVGRRGGAELPDTMSTLPAGARLRTCRGLVCPACSWDLQPLAHPPSLHALPAQLVTAEKIKHCQFEKLEIKPEERKSKDLR